MYVALTEILCWEMEGAGGELLSAYQCVVSHYVELHVLSCTQGVPFNLKTKADGNMIMYRIAVFSFLDYATCYTTHYFILIIIVILYCLINQQSLGLLTKACEEVPKTAVPQMAT